MSRKFHPVYGYGRAPDADGKVEPQTLSQELSRNPRQLPPRARSMKELASRRMGFEQADGTIIYLTGEEAEREQLVARALKGHILSARRLYGLLDEERAAWIANPRFKVRKRKIKPQQLVIVLNRMCPGLPQLMKLDIIQHIYANEYRIAPWVKQAHERHQFQTSIAGGLRRSGR